MLAIKIMSPRLAATSPARKHFMREARSSAAIRHENVVDIHVIRRLLSALNATRTRVSLVYFDTLISVPFCACQTLSQPVLSISFDALAASHSPLGLKATF